MPNMENGRGPLNRRIKKIFLFAAIEFWRQLICILTYCMHNAFKHLGNSSIITFMIFQVNVGHDAVDCSAVAALSRLRFKINLTKAGGIPRMYVELCGHRCKIQDVP